MSRNEPFESDFNKRYKLKQIGQHWFIEYDNNLTLLSFLTGVEKVALDQNVVFAGDDLYQIKVSVKGSIEVMKIKDACKSSSYDSFNNKQRYDSDTGATNTESEDNLKLDRSTESCVDKDCLHSVHKSDREDAREKRTNDYESMSDMASSIEIKGSDFVGGYS